MMLDDWQIGGASAGMWALYWRVVVKKAKLLFYQSSYIPVLTYGHKICVVLQFPGRRS